MSRLWLKPIALLIWLMVAVTASAQASDSVAIALSYRAPPECPDAMGLRDRVLSRLGRDPFAAEASQMLEVEIEGSGAEFRGRMALRGAVEGERVLGPVGNCADLVSAIASTLSIMLDSSELLGDEPEPAVPISAPPSEVPVASPPQSFGETTSDPPNEAADISPPRQTAISFGLAVRVGAAVSYLPQVALETELMGALELDSWSIEFGPRVRHALVDVDLNGVPTELATYGGRLGACISHDVLIGCLDIEVGIFRGQALRLDNGSKSDLLVDAGSRFGVRVPLAIGFGVHAMLGLSGVFTPLRIWHGDVLVWEAIPIAGSLVIGVHWSSR